MGKLFFTSDHHFGHDNILRYCRETRPYASVADMALDYLDKWNEVVAQEDTVYYLGDFSFKFYLVEEWLPLLHGRKHLVMGNHDPSFKSLSPEHRARYLAAGFESVALSGEVVVDGVYFALCHFPYRVPAGQEHPIPAIAAREQRFAPRSLASGALGEAALLHGHVHQHWRARKQPGRLPEINVAVDAWGGAPVSGEALVGLLREIRGLDHGAMNIYGEWLRGEREAVRYTGGVT